MPHLRLELQRLFDWDWCRLCQLQFNCWAPLDQERPHVVYFVHKEGLVRSAKLRFTVSEIMSSVNCLQCANKFLVLHCLMRAVVLWRVAVLFFFLETKFIRKIVFELETCCKLLVQRINERVFQMVQIWRKDPCWSYSRSVIILFFVRRPSALLLKWKS